jgi:hypothetical protein
MIKEALIFLKDELEDYLELVNNQPSTGDDFIVLSNVANDKGEWAIPPQKLGMSLINIEEERIFKDQQFLHRNSASDFDQYNPDIKLNLYILFCANYTSDNSAQNYPEGLKQLSNIISFFQGKYVFTPDNSPRMDPAMQKLIVELYSYTFEQQYNFWAILGAKYLPSVLYKVRLLTYQEKRVLNNNAPVTDLNVNANDI